VKVEYYVYKDYQLDVQGSSDEEIFANKKHRREIARKRYSFVSMRYHPPSGRLFLGCTNGVGDLLVEFNPKTGKFRSCGYARSGFWEPTQAKVHKGIWLDEEQDALYFGTSTLSSIPDTIDSEGGRLVRYRVADRAFDLVAAPVPGQFYQATGYDPARKRMYFYSIPALGFGVFDLDKKQVLRHDPMESIPHIGAIDDEGGVWGTYSISRQAFFRYLPDENRYEFPPACAFPEARKASNIMYLGAGPIDAMLNGGDGYLYAASALGEMIRIDPVSKHIDYLGKPFAGIRLPGMFLADDGLLYLCGGSDGAPMLARYDRDARRFEQLGRVVADDGETCFRCHELVVIDGVAYVGETDNRTRSGYLWACHL
jgi:hypothetical protein